MMARVAKETADVLEMRKRPIGVFDSGVGGLTVLHELLVALPREDFLYLGDSAHFPYGTKTGDELVQRVEVNTRLLLERGAKLVVIACNSASAAGAERARELAAEHGERDSSASSVPPR